MTVAKCCHGALLIGYFQIEYLGGNKVHKENIMELPNNYINNIAESLAPKAENCFTFEDASNAGVSDAYNKLLSAGIQIGSDGRCVSNDAQRECVSNAVGHIAPKATTMTAPSMYSAYEPASL